MPKNIVLCADGTADTFDSNTNVRAIIERLDVSNASAQIVFYDQGVGTFESRSTEFEVYRAGLGNPPGLLPTASSESTSPGRTMLQIALGLTIGFGIKENVRQLYTALAGVFEPGDRVFLFGFSRGAFTVRALAGLLYRCGLAAKPGRRDSTSFDELWSLFEPMRPPSDARAGRPDCPIHFLGLWETVKSYGILDPIQLPHLRHNPHVSHVRHALALHESRAFFQHTTWGLLDSDEKGAMIRLRESLDQPDLDRLEQQRHNIREVWFDGDHSAVGGGSASPLSSITLRWMLGEAVNVPNPLLLNDHGRTMLAAQDSIPTSSPHTLGQAAALFYAAAESIPRKEIDNTGYWPASVPAQGHTGLRDPGKSARGGRVYIHESVRSKAQFTFKQERVFTQTEPVRSAFPVTE